MQACVIQAFGQGFAQFFRQARVIAHCARLSYSLGPRPAPVYRLLVSPLEGGIPASRVYTCAGHIMYGPVYISATYLRRATLSVLSRRGPGKV